MEKEGLNVSCKMLFCTSFSSRRSLNIWAKTRHTTHARTQARHHLRGIDVLVKLIWVSDTRMIENLGHGDKFPEQNTITASNNIFRNPVSRSIPPAGQLTSDETIVWNGPRNVDARILLQFYEPLAP
jgi:hypothetical protein